MRSHWRIKGQRLNTVSQVLINIMSTCYYCKSTDLVKVDHKGEIVCRNCGTVNEESVVDPSLDIQEMKDFKHFTE